MKWIGLRGDLEESAAYQVEGLGFSLSDVRHIILTHLHLDHTGRLRDFPDAEVHILRTEFEAGMNPRALIERVYNPNHWSHRPKWVIHEGEYED